MATHYTYTCDTCGTPFDDDVSLDADRYRDIHTCQDCKYAVDNKKPPTLAERIIQSATGEGAYLLSRRPDFSHFYTLRLIPTDGVYPAVVPYLQTNYYKPSYELLTKEAFLELMELILRGYEDNPEWTQVQVELIVRSARKETHMGYTYVAKAHGGDIGGLYKIGASDKPHRRLSELNRQFGTACELIAQIEYIRYRALEQWLHKRYRSVRRSGEWFALTPDDVAYLSILAEQSGGKVYRSGVS